MHILSPVTDNCPSWKSRRRIESMLPERGIEPRTPDLRVRCPTDCATRPGLDDKFLPQRDLLLKERIWSQNPSSKGSVLKGKNLIPKPFSQTGLLLKESICPPKPFYKGVYSYRKESQDHFLKEAWSYRGSSTKGFTPDKTLPQKGLLLKERISSLNFSSKVCTPFRR